MWGGERERMRMTLFFVRGRAVVGLRRRIRVFFFPLSSPLPSHLQNRYPILHGQLFGRPVLQLDGDAAKGKQGVLFEREGGACVPSPFSRRRSLSLPPSQQRALRNFCTTASTKPPNQHSRVSAQRRRRAARGGRARARRQRGAGVREQRHV